MRDLTRYDVDVDVEKGSSDSNNSPFIGNLRA